MIYELAFAQLLGAVMGNALARFATTLGVYVTGLGLGSVLFKESTEPLELRAFVKAEIGLFVLGFLSPFIFTAIAAAAFRYLESEGSRNLLILFSTHLIIFSVGFLSGFELPILSALAERRRTGLSTSVLGADYAGMFLASLIFPLILFPYLGLISALWLSHRAQSCGRYHRVLDDGFPRNKVKIRIGHDGHRQLSGTDFQFADSNGPD